MVVRGFRYLARVFTWWRLVIAGCILSVLILSAAWVKRRVAGRLAGWTTALINWAAPHLRRVDAAAGQWCRHE